MKENMFLNLLFSHIAVTRKTFNFFIHLTFLNVDYLYLVNFINEPINNTLKVLNYNYNSVVQFKAIRHLLLRPKRYKRN